MPCKIVNVQTGHVIDNTEKQMDLDQIMDKLGGRAKI